MTAVKVVCSLAMSAAGILISVLGNPVIGAILSMYALVIIGAKEEQTENKTGTPE